MAQIKGELQQLLHSIRLDLTFDRGSGCWLEYQKNGVTHRVLDCVGGFGATFLGHNHPKLKQVIADFLKKDRPINTQGSIRKSSQKLAERLSELTGRTVCTLTNSGAETVEAAIKHAELSRKKRDQRIREDILRKLSQLHHNGVAGLKDPKRRSEILRHNESVLATPSVFLSLKGAFHGKTSGASRLTDSQSAYLPEKLPSRIDPHCPESLERVIEQHERELWYPIVRDGRLEIEKRPYCPIAGFFVEVVQGEGGIRRVSDEALRHFRKVCTGRKIPLIIDEIQTGLGRLGSVLGSLKRNITGDYYLLSKSLGGGILKVGALLVQRNLFEKEFSLIQTSTFSEDEISSEVSLKFLNLITEDEGALMKEAVDKGETLLSGLLQIKNRFPDVISEVRGEGLMIGLEFQNLKTAHSEAIRLLSDMESLTGVISGYLLHEESIRVLPTLSDPNTLRFEPSVLISSEEIQMVCNSIERICKLIRNQDAYRLLRYLVGREASEVEPISEVNQILPTFSKRFQAPIAHSPKVAFICHFIDELALTSLSPEFSQWSKAECRKFFDRTRFQAKPWLASTFNITSRTGKTVNFSTFALPITTRQILKDYKVLKTGWVQDLIHQSIQKALAKGCRVVGLGQFTSIITNAGQTIDRDDIVVTTGNSLTVALGVDAVLNERVKSKRRGTLAAVGATGNICEVYVKMLAPHFDRIILIGREQEGLRERLKGVVSGVARAVPFQNSSLMAMQRSLTPPPVVQITDQLDEVEEADVVISATSSARSLIFSRHLKRGAVVCDLSVPPDVDPSVKQSRPDVKLIHGGIAQLPNNENHHLPCFPPEPGKIYACMAETALLGMYGIRERFSWGPLEEEKIEWIRSRFYEEGFQLSVF